MTNYIDIGALQASDVDIGAVEASTAASPTPVTITGSTGGSIVISGGTGAVGNPVAGLTGGSIAVSGGTTGHVVANFVTGATGGTIEISGGANGAIRSHITGTVGGSIEVSGGVTGAVLAHTDRLATIYINGADVSQYVLLGIRRSIQLGGGSKATCSFRITNKPGLYRPSCGDEVVIYEGTTRFFAGLIDSTEEITHYQSGLIEIAVDCVDYGALCDRRVLGRRFELSEGAVASVTMGQIAMRKLSDLGVNYVTTVNDGAVGVQTFNWVTVTEAYNQVASKVGCDWRIDFFRNLYLISADTGYAGAPFGLTDNSGGWTELKVGRSAARKRNRQGVRNSQDLKTLWTDTFTGDGETRIFIPMAELLGKPIIRVNDVDQTVRAPGESGSYDFLWQSRSIMQNLAAAPLTDSDTITCLYPSPLSHVEWAENAADIAANGLYEAVDEVRDIATVDAMQKIAAALLEAGNTERVQATWRTDQAGLEPGMTISINTTYPLCNETLVIRAVESEEIGQKFFRHVVTAANSQTRNPVAMWQRLMSQGRQAKDRVAEMIRFTLAETIDGVTNPGLSVGAKQAVAVATKSGVLKEVTLYFKTGTTTEDISIDVYQNGTSIFGTTKLTWPAGQTGVVYHYEFASNPLVVGRGDVFTLEVLTADAAAMDGILELSILG